MLISKVGLVKRTKLTWIWRYSNRLGYIVAKTSTHCEAWGLHLGQPHSGWPNFLAGRLVDQWSDPSTCFDDPATLVWRVWLVISAELLWNSKLIDNDASRVSSVN